MREAAIPGYRLAKARHSTRVLISLGVCGLLLGLLSAVGMTVGRTGLTPAAVRGYYLGEQHGGSDTLAASEPRPFDELAEVTHLHLMGGSMLLFFLCHLLSVCDVSERFRTRAYVISFGSFLTTFTVPWLIVYVNGAFAVVFGPAIVTFAASLFVLCSVPLREMWTDQR